MHREFKALLPQATGISQFTIAIFLDIRGFSAFSQVIESPDTAMYIKRVYSKLIDDYFQNASFYKPTGDGLMVIIPYTESTLEETSAAAIRSSISCVKNFSTICDDDPMINFSTPTLLGVGIARGTACKISAGEKILDYSGRLLNLAARLTNLARPSGIVIDGDFKSSMIPMPERTEFKETEIYLRGIAEKQPRIAFIHSEVVNIPQENRYPIDQPKWETLELTRSHKELTSMGDKFRMNSQKPIDENKLHVTAYLPFYQKNKIIAGQEEIWALSMGENFELFNSGDKNGIELDIVKILKKIRSRKIKPGDSIKIVATYRPR